MALFGQGVMRWTTFVTLLVALLCWHVPAEACSIVSGFGPDFEVGTDDPPDDVRAPNSPTLILTDIHRGRGPQSEGCGTQSATSCDDIGTVMLTLESFDLAKGLLLETRGDTPFSSRDIPMEQPVTVDDGALVLVWVDGDADEQEPISFEIRAIAVDEYGRQSDPSAWVTVDDPGRDGGTAGCQTAVGPAMPALLLVFVMFGHRRRRDANHRD